MASKREIKLTLVGDNDQLSRTFGKSAKDAESFGSKVGGKAAGGLKAFGKAAAVGAGAVGVGLVLALKDGYDEFQANTKAAAQTAAVIKSTGAAAGVSAGHVKAMADSIEAKTGIDGAAIQSGENLLLTFKDLKDGVGAGNDMFTQSTAIMADMATALGKTPQSAAIMLGKAMNDPVKGLTALGEAGVSFTDAQKKSIKAMVASGDTMGAQKIIMGELTSEFGGSANAAGNTLPGMIARAKEAFHGLTEKLVVALLPSLTRLLNFVLLHMPQIEAVFRVVFAKIGAAWDTVLKPALSAIIAVLGRVAEFAVQNWPKVQAAAQTVIAWYQSTVAPAFENIVTAVTAIWDRFGGAFTRIVVTTFKVALAVITTTLANIKSVINIAMDLLTGKWGRAWDEVKAIVGRTLALVVTVIRGAVSIVLTAAGALGGAVWDGLKKGASSLGGNVEGLVGKIPGWVRSAAQDVFDAGSKLGGKIYSGIKDGFGDIASWISGKVTGAVNGIINRVNSLLEVHARISTGLPSPFPKSVGLDFNPPDIPRLARGGITNGPTLAVIGDNPGGREAVIPLPRGGFGRHGIGGTGGGATEIHVHVAGSVVSDRGIANMVIDVLRDKSFIQGGVLPARTIGGR